MLSEDLLPGLLPGFFDAFIWVLNIILSWYSLQGTLSEISPRRFLPDIKLRTFIFIFFHKAFPGFSGIFPENSAGVLSWIVSGISSASFLIFDSYIFGFPVRIALWEGKGFEEKHSQRAGTYQEIINKKFEKIIRS